MSPLSRKIETDVYDVTLSKYLKSGKRPEKLMFRHKFFLGIRNSMEIVEDLKFIVEDQYVGFGR